MEAWQSWGETAVQLGGKGGGAAVAAVYRGAVVWGPQPELPHIAARGSMHAGLQLKQQLLHGTCNSWVVHNLWTAFAW